MMHLVIILIVFAIAWGYRLRVPSTPQTWQKRWQQTLFHFLFSPLLLIMTAIAILCMGSQGSMWGLPQNGIGYPIVIGFLLYAIVALSQLTYQGWQATQQLQQHPQQLIFGHPARILNTSFLYSAQIGFWNPELVISDGLLACFDQAHLEAVIAHEKAHCYYRDTFWFFWLGALRKLTAWLPNTEILWQELLALRELRADRRAAQKVDGLLLAEALLMVAQQKPLNILGTDASICAALNEASSCDRLTERIDHLLAESPQQPQFNWWTWSPLLLVLLPLIVIPFHY